MHELVKRYHCGLLRSMYLSAMVSTATCPASKAYYQRKRSEGKGHKQALLALARQTQCPLGHDP